MSHPSFPISLLVRGRRCVVVGTSARAAERASRLRACGAEVSLLDSASFEGCDLSGVLLVMGHTDDPARDAAIVATARAAGALAYGHDLPAISDIAMPAVAGRGPLKLAISTDGEAPALARRLREELQRVLDEAGADLDALIEELIELRQQLPAERRGELYPRARRLRATGGLAIQGRNGDDPDDAAR